MIAVTQAPTAAGGNATSPAATSSNASPASPFDAILTLEALAATCASLDSTPLGGGALEGGGLDSLDDASGSDTDDDPDTEDGGPLAFLVNLLNLSAPITPDASDGADAVIDDALGGQAQKGTADP